MYKKAARDSVLGLEIPNERIKNSIANKYLRLIAAEDRPFHEPARAEADA